MCISVFGQNWQDENHVWNEEKGEWEVDNKAGGRVTNTIPENSPVGQMLERERPFAGEPWEKYLSRRVRNGERPPTQWELEEAQRKLWAKHVRTQRAMYKSEQRRQLIANRRATGWYADRRNAGLQHGYGAYNLHMNNVNSYRGGYNGY